MRKLTTSFCLILSLFLFSATSAWSADYWKGWDAYNNGDYATALREWGPLAKQGLASAQTLLGEMYANGVGVPQDYSTAHKWFSLAAEQGFAPAQFNLGLMYANGEGVIQDNLYAHMWWNIAASQGNENATNNRDIVAKRMPPADISAAQKLARECIRKNYKWC